MVAPQHLALPDPRAARGAPYTKSSYLSRTTPFNEILFQRPYLETTFYYWQKSNHGIFRALTFYERHATSTRIRRGTVNGRLPSQYQLWI
jgi:hypothetical protein